MAEVTIKSQLEGLYKEQYADKPENLIPEYGFLVREVSFRESGKLGESFNQPVVVSDEQGATYAGPEEDAFTLNVPEAMATKNAKVQGCQILMRSAIGYKAAAAAVGGGKKAFVSAIEMVNRRMMKSLAKRVELSHLYGGSGLGRTDASTNVSLTSTTINFTSGHFAAGIWIGAKGAKIDLYDVADDSIVNEDAALTIVEVDVENKLLTIEGDADDIADIDTLLVAGAARIFWRGAFGKESLGLDALITTDGEVLNIDTEDFDLWRGQRFAVGGGIDMEKLSQAVIRLQNFGFEGKLTLLCNPLSWVDLMNEAVDKRQYDASYKPSKMENGFRTLEFYIQNIVVEVVSHPCVKEADAFLVPLEHLARVGAWEMSNKTPGRGDEIFQQLPNNSGFEIRAYTDQALFTDHLSYLLKMTGITHS